MKQKLTKNFHQRLAWFAETLLIIF